MTEFGSGIGQRPNGSVLTFAKFDRHWLVERVRDTRLPLWQRVSLFAAWRLSYQTINNTLKLKPGALRDALTVDSDTGEVYADLGTRPRLDRAITKAIEMGWLGEGSTEIELHVPVAMVHVGRRR